MNRALLILGLAALDVCWLYPWSVLLALWLGGSSSDGLLSPLTMVALILVAAVTTYVAVRRLGARRRGQTALIVFGLLASVVAVRLDVYSQAGALDWLDRLAISFAQLIGGPTAPALAFLLGLLLWRRGAQLGSDTPTFPDVEGAFRWSIGALIVFALVLAVGVRPSLQQAIEARATPYVVGSFFVALLTLALARLESLRTRTQALALNTQWLGVLIAIAGLLVLGSLAVAQVLSFDLLLIATRPFFDLLGRVVLILLYLVVVPLAYVIELLVYWLLQLISPQPDSQPPEPPQPADVENFLQRLFGQMLSPEMLATLKAVGALLVLGIALLLVARTVARWKPRFGEVDAAEEERDSVYQPGSLRQALLAWLLRLFRRRSEALAEAAASASLAQATDTEAGSSVREVYRRLLGLGESAGAARPPSSTPYEHEPALNSALHAAEPIAELTDAYVQVRYAEVEPPAGELERLQAALREISANEEPAAG